jgi:sirohydrochlorin cobaltochelatase
MCKFRQAAVGNSIDHGHSHDHHNPHGHHHDHGHNHSHNTPDLYADLEQYHQRIWQAP